MKSGIQMRGHCQMCGRIHAVSGTVAKHGYTVEHGWFQGVCPGADYEPIEQSRGALDQLVVDLRRWAGNAEDEARKLERREIDPEGKWSSYSEMGYRKRKLIPYETLLPYEQADCRDHAVHANRRKAEDMRRAADDLLTLADRVHGQPLIEVVLDADAKAIKPGDKVKVCGMEVTVTKIAEKTARGVGPFVNGRYMDHVFWLDANGGEHSYPKRYARKVKEVANG